MSVSVDKYLAYEYKAGEYTCHNFANDVWLAETGQGLGDKLVQWLNSGRVYKGAQRGFVRLRKPESPCIALFKPVGKGEHHVGIYLRGRILHLSQKGVKFEALETAVFGYREIRFYKCQST